MSFTKQEWRELNEKAEFTHVTATTGGNNILSSDVAETRMQIPLALYLSDTSGSDNTVDIKKVEEDDSTTDIHPNFNLGANETVVLSAEETGVFLPRLEGGANLEFTAGSSDVEVTLVHIDNIEV